MEQKEEKLQKKKLLQPKNDVVFQALFSRGKENITKALLEGILKTKIHKLELDKSKELQNDNIQNKNGRLDLRVIINDNVECDIELQLASHEKMLERFLYYWSKMYTANLKVGDKYTKLRKTISIIIVDDDIQEVKDIVKSQTKWQIREEEYTDKILTPYLEIGIIELRKAIKEYEKDKENAMLQWMLFLNNPETKEVQKIMEENQDIKEAKEELDRISQDDILQRMALKAEIERMDQEQRMYEAERDGKLEGEKIGEARGKKIGEKQAKLETAKKMLEEDIPLETIIKIIGLTKEEILKEDSIKGLLEEGTTEEAGW